MGDIKQTAEYQRLVEYRDRALNRNWKLWGPYLSERQWGTVREYYDASKGDSWHDFVHDDARFRAYRWGEDGIAGVCDDHQRLCFALAFWNYQDDIIKERLFGLTNSEGNNGEDVKEYYYYLDNTPTHSYMKYLYKYPQQKYPYYDLTHSGRKRGEPEFELLDTRVFAGDRYWDMLIEYAKAACEDLAIKVTVTNRGAETQRLAVIPTLWFRNIWSWSPGVAKPSLTADRAPAGSLAIRADEDGLGTRWLYCREAQTAVYTENETDREHFGWGPNASPYLKDGIDRFVRTGDDKAVNPAQTGTKAAALYHLEVAAGASRTLYLRLTDQELDNPFDGSFDDTFQSRIGEADQFYAAVCAYSKEEDPDLHNIQRQAFAGLLWNKQFYHYIVKQWVDGDGGSTPPQRLGGANDRWDHLYSKDILSMPDTWEYPWFAAWDLAFHTTTLALIDPDFAKSQLLFLVMEWYMHPNGSIPAYEYGFSDVNPPVHAWAAWKVYLRDKEINGTGDLEFLRRVFTKLGMNFTWWVNQVDWEDNNLFEGGFLGMDNIRIVDTKGGTIEQSDGTGWMAMYCLNMMVIAAELVNQGDARYRDSLRKYFQHFLYISNALNNIGQIGLWDDQENFYFDVFRYQGGSAERLKVFSLVGLIPLFAIARVDVQVIHDDSFEDLARTFNWFLTNRADLTRNEDINFYPPDAENKISDSRFKLTLSIVSQHRLQHILEKVLDPAHFLSDYGVRSLSRFHLDHPYQFRDEVIRYEPAESIENIKGGNSNWRGPIWFPINYLIIDSLRKYHEFMDGTVQVLHKPVGASEGAPMTLDKVAEDLSQRLIALFKRQQGRRPVFGGIDFFDRDPADPVLFYEYFHGDNGAGIGASHQTGWTALVASLIHELKGPASL